MFTGLIEEIGEVVAVRRGRDALRLIVRGPTVAHDAEHGDSIAVSGVCLTVVDGGAGDPSGTFTADVMEQSLRRSTLGALVPGDAVNLERALRAGDRLGGHIVQGHVEGEGEVRAIVPGEAWRVLRCSLPPHLAPLLVEQGSLTVSGVSLTVSDVAGPGEAEPWFEVALIPETLAATTLGSLVPGSRVNLETDILARHVARLVRFGDAASGSSSAPDEGDRR